MHLTSIIVGLAALGFTSAQTTTSTVTSAVTTTSTTYSMDPTQSAIIACLHNCPEGDVNCTAKCIAVPNPDTTAVNATNNCVADCPKGNGTATDNLNYQNCVNGCIGKYYFTTSGTPSNPTGASAGTASGVTAPTGTTTGKGSSSSAGASGSGSTTGTGAPASQTSQNAGAVMKVATTGLGLGAFLAALMAL
ncbi:hypothetical protein DL546_003297 [Coniochaeta pulveracea]|uniref:Uncharacterized protein n=1 Tax=Coniochaeta pulveracea TaxID=177199 RepID=A0A420Y445_9PEZI|nr:hypothetical protein DL546_003297 [Coniochaeta pulveracea]